MISADKGFSIFAFIVAVLAAFYATANTVYINQVRELVNNDQIDVDASGADFFFWINLIVAILAYLYIGYAIFNYFRIKRKDRKISEYAAYQNR